MRQFDVYEHPVAAARNSTPFVVVLSSHLLPSLAEVVIAPLTHLRVRPANGLEVPVSLNGEPLVLLTADIASIAFRRLGRRAGDIAEYEDEIRRALERLFSGF